MNDLDKCRQEIDEIDRKLVDLFEKRMDVAKRVAEYKKKNNMNILNEKREAEVIEKSVDKLKNKEYSTAIKKFFTNLMELSRELQGSLLNNSNTQNSKVNLNEQKKVGYQGVPGSFSEEALLKYCGNNIEKNNFLEFLDVFEALKNNKIDYGIVPIENSYTGAITQVYDLLVKYGFYIVGEECIKIDQHLMMVKGSKLDDIEEIYSHPQGFEQSRGFLNNYKNIKLIPYYNTATSAKFVSNSNDKSKAAIASKRAADIYGLDIIKSCINDKNDNYTKFIIIGRNKDVSKQSNKVTVVFSLNDEAGTLYRLLRHFAENNINMIKVESRPNKHESWKYLLYVDFEGNIYDEEVKNALKLIKENSGYFKLLGNYVGIK